MDERSFQLLYDATAQGLHRYLRHVLGDSVLADDIAQEAYLRMLKVQVPTEMTLAQQKNYLYKIASNLVNDFRRSRRVEASIEKYEPSAAPAADRIIEVRAAFGELKTRERDLLWLAYVECFSHKEIAEFVRTTPASVRPMLARAREKLRGLFSTGRIGGRYE
ncbi:RNA polymerase sigma factor [Bryobacter aggregatus]|uniref:RNA polymerase sigma factor n=1 Tax=Bryobacter aggregatus TaxID=360054 RepID=UPI0004E21FE4|nr:RNA polymerase sigma factor [Bryobacter aggregatus]